MTYLPRVASAEEALQFPLAEAALRGTSGTRLAAHLASIWRRLHSIIEKMADHYVASALYEALSRLSDDELHQRGLSRANLARDVRAVCRRNRRPDRDQVREL
jgi:hypothetical protein